MMAPQIKQDVVGALKVIRLNRPEALNALSLQMLMQLHDAIKSAINNDNIKAIWLESAHDRGFCAGGDVKALAQEIDGLEDPAEQEAIASRYFNLEYGVDLLIEQCPKPIVVFADGLVYGGGWGLFAGAQLKLCTERSSFSMPENQIGFYPDVGAAEFLQRPDWKQGTFLGLSGMAISAHQAMALNYVDDIIDTDYAEVLKTSLSDGLHVTDLDIESAELSVNDIAEQWREAMTLLPDDASLNDWINIVQQHAGTYEFFQQTDLKWQTASAWSLAFTWQYFRQMRSSSRETVLTQDAIVGSKLCSHNDFYEGVHAKLIDKNREPHWLYPHVESVPLEHISEILPVIENNT